MGFADRFKKLLGDNRNPDTNENKMDFQERETAEEASQIMNFKHIDDLIQSGEKEIALNSDVVLGDEEELQYCEGIEIGDDGIVIDGKGHSIDACGKTRIFKVTGKNVLLKNIKLKNGFLQRAGGGAIYNEGVLSILNAEISKNETKTGFEGGGAILNKGNLSVKDSRFFENHADDGCAIYNWQGNLHIVDSILSNNSSQWGSGGVIGNNRGNIKISNSALNSNHSHNGGVINNWRGDLNISDSQMSGNEVDEDGGVIFDVGGNICISNSKISDNRAGYMGGALQLKESSLKVFGSQFINNSSTHKGGAVNAEDSTITVIKCDFKSNSAQYAGAICNNGDLIVRKSSLLGNSADKDGSAIQVDGGKAIIENSNACHNDSKSGSAIGNGGGDVEIRECEVRHNNAKSGSAIRNSGKMLIFDSKISENLSEEGETIYNSGEIEIIESSFSYNRVNGGLGIISHAEGMGVIKSTDILNNISNGDGATIAVLNGQVKIFDSEISNNVSSNDMIVNRYHLEIDNSIIKDNMSRYAISNSIRDDSSLDIHNTKILDNECEAAIFNDGQFCYISKSAMENPINVVNHSNLTLKGLKIEKSDKTILNRGYVLVKDVSYDILDRISSEGKIETAEDIIPGHEEFGFQYLDELIHRNGCGNVVLEHDICIGQYESEFYEGGIELDIDDLVIDGNGRVIDGSDMSRIFLVTAKNVKLKNIIFKNALSYHRVDGFLNNCGGALKVNSKVNLTLEDCKFINNHSKDDGGAISNSGELMMRNCTLSGNICENRGGVITNRGSIEMEGCSLSDNDAGDGGAIFNDFKGEIKIRGCELTGNNAKNGGAIYNMNRLSIFTSSFLKNSSSWHGGAIFNMGGDLDIECSALDGNACGNSGAAICNWAESSNLKIENCELKNNSAEFKGGSIYNMQARLTVDNSIFSNNVSSNDGGAVYSVQQRWFIRNCKFINNKSGNDGGAIHQHHESYPKFDIENKLSTCIFDGNDPDNVFESYEPGL